MSIGRDIALLTDFKASALLFLFQKEVDYRFFCRSFEYRMTKDYTGWVTNVDFWNPQCTVKPRPYSWTVAVRRSRALFVVFGLGASYTRSSSAQSERRDGTLGFSAAKAVLKASVL